MDENWLVKLFPFLFKKGPDNKYYLWFVNFIVYNDRGDNKVYCFLTKETYLNSNYFDKLEEYTEHKITILGNNVKALKDEIDRKKERIEYLENEYQKRIDRYQSIVNDLENKIKELEGQIEKHKEKNNELAIEKSTLINSFENLIKNKDDVISSLRVIINSDREAHNKEAISIEENHFEQIKLLSKQLEYLDQDFIDVAKAMRLYNKKEDRPLRGFRIKTND